MNLDNINIILEQLIAKTQEEKITWEKTSKSKSYKASLSKSTVVVEKSSIPSVSTSGAGLTIKVSFTFQLFDEKGEKIYSKSTSNGATGLLKPSPLVSSINNNIVKLFNIIEDASDSNLKDIIDELTKL